MNKDTRPAIEPTLHAAPEGTPADHTQNKTAQAASPSPSSNGTPEAHNHGSALDQLLRGQLSYGSDTAPLIKETISKLDFERGIVYLEEIVKKIENNPGDLDRNTQLYAVGELLRLHCDNKLKQSEARVEQILKDTQGQVTGTDPLEI